MIEESLPCVLTESELADIAKKLGDLEIEISAAREAKKSANKQFNEMIANLQEKIDAAAVIAASGQEYRMVKCDWVMDLPVSAKRLIRRDTLREVRAMVLSEEDMQGGLFETTGVYRNDQ